MKNWESFGRKQWWTVFKVLTRHSPEETGNPTKNVSQDSLSLGRDFNPGPPEYEAEVLTIRT
jgi:hypothetical protein